MAHRQITNDDFIIKLRSLFTAKFKADLDIVLTPEGGDLCNDAFYIRAVNYHHTMVPWINSVRSLNNTRVLEIGCGSGAATLALAQQCATIDAFDIDQPSLDRAKENAAYFGVTNARFHLLAPDWALPDRIAEFSAARPHKYDVALLPAVLEHLLLKERVPVLGALWSALRPGGILVIYDTPNRLYPLDSHSFRMPFANWLPDELMLAVMGRSPRAEYPQMINAAANKIEAMYRLGRGASYHEFELAIGLQNMRVLNDGYSKQIVHREANTAYEGMLADVFSRHAPMVPVGFSKAYLELVIEKRWETIETIDRVCVTDEMLDGDKPAVVLHGDGSRIRYRLPESPSALRFDADVLRHPWSSMLRILADDGSEISRHDLYNPFHVIEQINVALPPGTREIELRTTPDRRSLGQQAWILGAGVRPVA